MVKIAKTETQGNQLVVTVESDNLAPLLDLEAKQLAYAERVKHGMENAGISTVGGTFVPADEADLAKREGRSVRRWQREFRLIPML